MSVPLSSPSSPSPWQRLTDAWLTAATILLGLFLLVSTAGTAIALVAMLIGCIMAAPRVWQLRLWRDPLVIWGVVFFIFIVLHEWMIQVGERPLAMSNHYGELWRLPIVLTVFALIRRTDFFWIALLISAAILAVVNWMSWWGFDLLPRDFVDGRRISMGFGLVAVAWLALMLSYDSKRPWLLRGMSVFLVMTLLFVMQGRTAHMLVILLAALAGWMLASRRVRWLLAVALPVGFIILALTSKSVQNRMEDSLSVFAAPPGKAEVTSSGLRKQFYQSGLEIAMSQPWWGVGLSGIPDAYEATVRAKAEADPRWVDYASPEYARPSNLHNEYLMLWAGTGILGLISLLVWLAIPLRARGLSHSRKRALRGLVLTFAAGSLLNSWLLDFTPGHIYIVLLAWLVSQRYREAAV